MNEQWHGRMWWRWRLRAGVLVGLLFAAVLVASVEAGGNLINHGGSVLKTQKVYITYWGQDWADGFTDDGHSSTDYRAYLEGFIGGVGGSAWAGSQTQYGSGNPAGTLGGTWVDTGYDLPLTPAGSD